jgi:hypothetical protein
LASSLSFAQVMEGVASSAHRLVRREVCHRIERQQQYDRQK